MTTEYHWPEIKPGFGEPLVRYRPVDPSDLDHGSTWIARFHPTGAEVKVTYSRERQYPGFNDNREHDHGAMYRWAAERIGSAGVILDYGCGCGWGASVLAQVASEAVVGLDVSQEALSFACRAFPGVFINCADIPLRASLGYIGIHGASAIVAVESIEHVEDDEGLCREWRECVDDGARLYLTTPDAGRRPPGYVLTPYHVREYTRAELTALLERTGWRPLEWRDWGRDISMGVIAEAV